MRCEECGRMIENAEMWQLGGDRNAPTSRSMRQMCWECRTKTETAQEDLETQQPKVEKSAPSAQKSGKADAPLSKTVISEVNEAARAFESGAA